MSGTWNVNWKEKANNCIAHGALTNSKRPSAFIEGVYPTHMSSGHGCYLYDEFGNDWIDFISGLGCSILGYSHPRVNDEAIKALRKGPCLSLSSTMEVKLAERIKELTGYDKVRFFKTGTEACMAAVRIAKAYASNTEDVFSSGYHGWSDAFVSIMEPGLGKYSCLSESISSTFEAANVAIIEPLQLNINEDVINANKIRNQHKCVIFDEIITGFRVPKFFVSKWWDIKPDILVFGKAMANGFPLSCVCMSDELAKPEWFCSGTFSGELASLGACKAVLDEITEDSLIKLYADANKFMDKLNEIMAPIGVKIEGYGTRGMFDVSKRETCLVMQEAAKRRVLFGKAFFFNFAHMKNDHAKNKTLDVIGQCVDLIKEDKVTLEGNAPVETFKR